MKYMTLILCCLAAAAFAEDMSVYSPGFPPSQVDAEGGLIEDWGRVVLRLEQPGGAVSISQNYSEDLFPIVTTTATAGSVSLEQAVYRAPIWPGGMDVLEARLTNTGRQAAAVRLAVETPNNVLMGEHMGVANGRSVLALPQQSKVEREELVWGHTGGITPMPGWATPQGECDPAFRNISAGMGGVPIHYRFAVPTGAARTVALGFCESFHDTPGRRPLVAEVEDAPAQEIDPLALWGRHVPGCAVFPGRDENEDGHLEVTVSPHPRAGDKNPILNAIWIFAPETAVDIPKVIRGAANSAAEYFVDVGGQRDQCIYKSGKVAYELELEPGASREWLFFVGSPGGGPVPAPGKSAWDRISLRRAAEEVWKGRKTPGGKL